MASRHMTTLLWLEDGGWESALNTPDIDEKEARLGLNVRYALTRRSQD